MAIRLLAPLLFICVADSPAQEQRERLPGWNASFAIPSGWRVLQVSGRAAVLTDSLESGALFVTAGYLKTSADAEAELAAMFADLHYRATPTVAMKDTAFSGHPALIATYTGSTRTGSVQSRAAVVFSTYGTGVVILGVTAAERFSTMSAAVAQVASSIEALLPATNVAAVSALSGHWDYVAPAAAARDSTATGKVAIDEWLEFDGRERFTWHSRTVVAVPGATTMIIENRDDAGTYTVVGKTLILRGKTPRALDIMLAANALSVSGRAFQRKQP
jgi:hypothetical protein